MDKCKSRNHNTTNARAKSHAKARNTDNSAR